MPVARLVRSVAGASITSVVAATVLSLAAGVRADGPLPDGFVHLSAIEPTIVQEMRYYGPHNFIGAPIDGYHAPECVLTRAAAEALAAVHRELRPSGLAIKVFDCYRPQRAVEHFVRWSKVAGDETMKTAFYPDVAKADFFALGYVAAKSGHSRGSTVDVTIVPAGTAPRRIHDHGRTDLVDCRAPLVEREDDNGLDFGTGYDCFDPASHPTSMAVGAVARHNRALLAHLMGTHGFRPLPEEWWHFTLKEEPYADTYFDFPIVAPQGAPPATQP